MVERVRYLNGRYRLVEPLGAGGMSVVWRAYDEVLGRLVAVKMLAPALAADPRSRERIRDEARAAALLSHPHITAVHDYGESEAVPFVVMELVDGRPLEGLEPLPWRTAVAVCAEVGSALAAVHARGLVHRDIKPANVMFTERGAKLVDFGISAIAGDLADHGDAGLLGTPAYLAPERLSGAPTAPATDVYALGILLYKALSGQYPWDADTPAMILSAHKHRPPKPLPDIHDLPGSVAALCRRCLARNPDERPTADEVTRELYRSLTVKPRKALVRAGAAAVGVAAAVLVFFASGLNGNAGRPSAAGATQPIGGSSAGASARAAGSASAPIGCLVHYTTTAQAGGAFTASLSVTNTGKGTASNWRLNFRLANGQVLARPASGSLLQRGAEVVVTDPSRPDLTPGLATQFALSGRYTSINPLPTDFRLNGVACEEVLLVNPPINPPAVKKSTADPAEKDDHGKGKKHGKD